jgi:hypothetical protein
MLEEILTRRRVRTTVKIESTRPPKRPAYIPKNQSSAPLSEPCLQPPSHDSDPREKGVRTAGNMAGGEVRTARILKCRGVQTPSFFTGFCVS